MFDSLNEGKIDLFSIYNEGDPRKYYTTLGQLDYIIPHLAQPIFHRLIAARAGRQSSAVTVLDLGASYGINGALMRGGLSWDLLRARYAAPAIQALGAAELLALDKSFLASWPRPPGLIIIGLDSSALAIAYAEASGALDRGFAADLELEKPDAAFVRILANVDIVISTGCVGYVGQRTFELIARHACRTRPAWFASFVLRMFPFDAIAATLAAHGLVTEKLEGATFVQRRFADRQEMTATLAALARRGLDATDREESGLFHAEFYLSRPRAAIAALPLHDVAPVVSGANKPWQAATDALLAAQAEMAGVAARPGRAHRPRRLSAARGS